jgi:hypothetical protein
LNTKSISLCCFIVFFQFFNTVQSQSAYQIGLLPAFNINNKFKKGWSLNTKIESRQLFQRGVFNTSIDRRNQYVLTDLSFITAKKVGLNSRIAGGYLMRFEDGDIHHRFIQQFIVVQRKIGYRLAHRFFTDQTFSKVEDPQFRLRYRLTTEIPLNGESVDSKEFYLKFNNEYINSLQSSAYDLEVRLIPLLGYDISEDFKIETGLDYRVNSFLRNNTRHSFWMSINLFFEIGG